ncbi:MAG: hypothetical protein J0H00_19710 [Burkholderiales bacterium]|nr:hypothetical protein [Burkholderiales bacterium]
MKKIFMLPRALLIVAFFGLLQQQASAANTCSAIESMIDLASRYADVYTRHGDIQNALDLRERELGLRQRFTQAGCGNLDRVRESRRQLERLWGSSGSGVDWKYLGKSDDVHLQYILVHRRNQDIGAWLIYNYPGTIPEGNHIRGSGSLFKSSAQLVRVSCQVDLYSPIGTLWFGDGSTLGEIVGVEEPGDDDSSHEVPPDSLMGRLRNSECAQTSETAEGRLQAQPPGK